MGTRGPLVEDAPVAGRESGPIDGGGRIAVLGADAVGDLIFSLPALESLRAACPEAGIVLLGRAWHAAFLHERPGPVDRAW